MKTHVSLICAVVLACAPLFCAQTATPVAPSSSPQSAGTLNPLAEQLITLEKALSDSQKKHDRDFYKNTTADDFISVGTDGKIHPKAEALGDFASTAVSEYRPYDIQVVPLNDGAAVVTYDVIVRTAHYDDETPRYQHISSIWVKQGESWKLKFQQATAAQ